MADLMCSALSCVNNLNGFCSATVIHVYGESAGYSDETKCNTFAEKGIINAFSNLANMNIPGEIRQLFSGNTIEMSPIIKCDAVKCVYNKHEKCSAKNVEIIGDKLEKSKITKCDTFINKR
ncbi:MAG: DUF1540 domain-containing protein [Bacillota bacterium]|nr:DUF1540 domain-containing protein [Bacillota bacterium]